MPGRVGRGEGEEGFALNELQSGSSEQSKKKRTRRLILCGNNETGTYSFSCGKNAEISFICVLCILFIYLICCVHLYFSYITFIFHIFEALPKCQIETTNSFHRKQQNNKQIHDLINE